MISEGGYRGLGFRANPPGQSHLFESGLELLATRRALVVRAEQAFVDPELAESLAVLLKAFAARVIGGQEALLEEENLMGRLFAVIDDEDKKPPQIDLHAGDEFGQGLAIEVIEMEEGEFAGVDVQLDEIGLPRVAVEAGGAFDVDAENRGKPVEEGAMNREVPL